MYYNKPTGKNVIRVCADPACGLRDADGLLKKLCGQFDVEPHQTHPELDLTIEPSPCLGLCDQVPAMLTTKGSHALEDFGMDKAYRPKSSVGGTLRLLTKNCGGETTSLKNYGAYSALKKAKAMSREDVVNEIKTSGLVGRGGAAYPTGIKWEGALKAEADQKYVICNADESEPGTFKDRILLLDDPHKTIEGMCIAAYTIGATKGYIYIRGEYPYIVPTGFVGGQKPTAVPPEQVLRVTQQMETGAGKPRPKLKFSVGENVTVVDGPFTNFNGTVEDINEEKGKVKVWDSFFGRATPVELDFIQVQKA